MQLKAIELSGFKSFSKKTELDLTAPITAIVGPNGSGKSNVAEAVSFVLGEQSMKSMRGKVGTDLIFKGSPKLSAVSRALVVIIFDNRDKTKAPFGDGQSIVSSFSDFDEIRISREIFADGTSEYKINGSQVRLKDVAEFLASARIGSGGHHIISQGEADRILHASEVERKEMIEDSLGLKLYQWRIRESERKLEKMAENIREAEISRREIAPHLGHLKRQMEKIEKGEEMKHELLSLYRPYLSAEAAAIDREKGDLGEKGGSVDVENKLKELDKELSVLKQSKDTELAGEFEKKEKEHRHRLGTFLHEKEKLARSLGRVEAEIEFRRDAEKAQEEGTVSVSYKYAESFSRDVEEALGKISWRLERQELKDALTLFTLLRRQTAAFFSELFSRVKRGDLSGGSIKTLEEEEEKIKNDLASVEKSIMEEERALSILQTNEKKEEKQSREREHRWFEVMSKKSELSSGLELIRLRERELKEREERFTAEVAEGSVLVGPAILEYRRGGEKSDLSHEDVRRKIERLKVRLEDIGVADSSDVKKAYEEVRGRDEFLSKEISDLIESRNKLVILIEELENKLAVQFSEGLIKINREFLSFFKEMFSGGEARLDIVRVEKKNRGEEFLEGEEVVEDGDSIREEKEEYEEGIDIKVSLPQKKVRDLNMLSGGERALTSIALLFAISQVNPPPFLVLDETDAALDEANSKRYGNMLESLSKHSKLVVVTHNRETMSRANVLYGVTIGSDGASRLLSVRLNEASGYAK